MRVVVHIEDGRYNGIRPSHFDGVRMGCEALGVTELAVIDRTEDGFFVDNPDVPKFRTFQEFEMEHQGEDITILAPYGVAQTKLSVLDWLVIGPSGGLRSQDHLGNRIMSLDLVNPLSIEPRDALFIALARI